MNKRGHAAHALFKAPSTTPSLTRCVSLKIPDSDEWQMVFLAAFASLETWINYERSGTTRESEVAQKWRQVRETISFGNCNTFEGVSIMPVASVIPWAGSIEAIPDGWLYCNGAFYEPLDYPDLYAVIDPAFHTTIEIAPGVDIEGFRVPDMRSSVALGTNPVDGQNELFSVRVINENGGAESVVLTSTQMPAHQHTIPTGVLRTGGATYTEPSAGTGISASGFMLTGSSGSGNPHENLPPFIGLHYIIKAVNDEITGTPGEDGSLTMLRQNPLNPFLMEQSFNGGVSWSPAFDYEILKCRRSGGTDIDIITTITNITNYIEEINNQYDGDIINIYPDFEYEGNDDDLLRDLTLCWTLRMVFEAMRENLAHLADEHEEKPDLGDLIESAGGVVVALFGGAASVAGFLVPGAQLLAIVTLIGSTVVLNEAVDNMNDVWGEYIHGNGNDIRAIDYDSLLCCIFNALRGELLTETLWKSSFIDCLSPVPDTPLTNLMYLAAMKAIGIADEHFAVWLDLLNTGFTAQKAGVVFDNCPCMIDCLVATFEDADTEGWTAGENTSHVLTEGFRGNLNTPAGNRNARCLYDFGENVFIRSVKLEWYCPRTDDAQFYNIQISENGTDWTMLKDGNYQPVGRQTETWSGENVLGRYVRLTVAGTNVANRDGQIYGAQICYIPIA